MRAGLDWDALAAQEVPATYIPDVSASNSSVGPAASAALVLEEEAAATSPPIPAAEQSKFAGYEYRVHANDDKAGRTERVQYRPSSGGLSFGPESMRQSTISMAQTTEVLNGASVANYASMNYRATEVGGSAVYGPASSPASGSGLYASRKTLGVTTVSPANSKAGVAAGGVAGGRSTAGSAAAGLYILTPVSPVSPVPAAMSSPVTQATGPSMPVAPADAPPGRVPLRSNSFAQEQARLAALELHEHLVGDGSIPLGTGGGSGSPRLATGSGGLDALGRRSSVKGSRRISRSLKVIALAPAPGAVAAPVGGEAYAVGGPS